MTYANRWLLAVALKRDYPQPETGATEEPTPPVFTAEQVAPAALEEQRRAWGKGILTGLAAGLVIGIGGLYLYLKPKH